MTIPLQQAGWTPRFSVTPRFQQREAVRFGADPTTNGPADAPKPPATGDSFERQHGQAAGEKTPGRISRFFSKAWASTKAFFRAIWNVLWPLNWPIFKKAPTSVDPAGGQKIAPNVDNAAEGKPAEAPDTTTTTGSSPKEAGIRLKNEKKASHKPKTFGERLKDVGHVLLNTLLFGSALFVLGGTWFLHLPAFTAIGAILGIQLIQTVLINRYMDKDDKPGILDAKKMAKLRGKLVGKFKRFPKIQKTLNKILAFFFHVVQSSVIQTKMPDTWEGRLKMVFMITLQSTIQLLTGPFGATGHQVATALTTFFRLNDAKAIMDVFNPAKMKKNTRTAPPAPDTGASPQAA